MRRLVLSATAALALVGAAGSASADILASVADNGLAIGSWSNSAANQNFLMQFTLGQASTITGFDIVTVSGFGALGTDVTVRLRSNNDALDQPDTANLAEFTGVIDSNVDLGSDNNGTDQLLVGTHFAGISLAAGTYWMGMSSTFGELGWSSFDYGDFSPPHQAQMSGETYSLVPSVSSFA